MLDLLNLQQWSRPVILLFVFLMVFLVAMTTAAITSSRADVRRRLVKTGGSVGTAKTIGSLRQREAEGTWIKLVNAVEKRGVSLTDTKDASLRAKLVAAGYAQPHAPRVFTLIRLLATLGLPTTYVALAYSSGSPPSLMRLYLVGGFLALMSLYIPNLVISAKADRRSKELVNGFPDALDLMLVCVEAGLGLDAAFSRVGSEMSKSHPLLAELLGTVVLELRAGRSREDALRRMADRAGVEDIRSFATLLIQSNKLGSSVGTTLRVYASEMRERRKMRAEEKAHRLPVLLSVPLVACMLPVMIGVLMLPAAIRVVRQIMPAMAGS